jgi:hypothetical protein
VSLQAENLFFIPPITTNLKIEDQPVSITISGSVSTAPSDSGARLHLQLEADLSDLQRQIAPILRAQLNSDNRCGDRLSVAQVTLAPAAPASRLIAHVHYEKWGCAKAFGKEIVKKLIGGNAVLELCLTPVIESSGLLQLRAEVKSLDADGQLGEALRSGSLSAALQEKIRKSVVSAVEKSTQLSASLPAAVRELAALRTAEFAAGPEDRLRLMLTAQADLTAQQVEALSTQLKTARR